jgi:small subunit ribosomal protein S24e
LSTLEIISDEKNDLLERREVRGVFKGGNGFLTRGGAADAIASKLGVEREKVQVTSLEGKFGQRDLSARAYVFSNVTAAKKQLPKYLLIRQLSKDERKKAQEEKKKKGQAPPATPSEGKP